MIDAINYDINNPPKSLKTKWGTARINANGYYAITSRKEGNHLKTLHRLIFEDFYNIKIEDMFPNQTMIVHHVDGNKLNNNIWNLDILNWSDHSSIHLNKKIVDSHQEKSKHKMSKTKNTTGFFRVVKEKSNSYTNGFRWAYQYYITPKKRKTIASVNLEKLMEKVIKEGASWKIINQETAKRNCEIYDYDFDKLCKEVN